MKFKILTILAGLGCLAVTGSASAFSDPPVKLGPESEIKNVTRYVVEASPRSITGVEPDSLSKVWLETTQKTSPEFDAAVVEELAAENATLLSRAKVWVWNLAPKVSIGLSAGFVGWEIGSHVFGGGFDSTPSPTIPESYAADQWRIYGKGEMILSVGEEAAVAPDIGWVGTSSAAPFGRHTNTKNCEMELRGPGTEISTPNWTPSSAFCFTSQHLYERWKPFNIVKCGVGVECAGIGTISYSGANQPTAPTGTALESTLKTELENEDFPVENRLVNHLAKPEQFPDPRVTKLKISEENRRCDRSPGPSYENAEGNASPELYAKKVETPFTVTNRPEGYEEPVYLRYGRAKWVPGAEGFGETPYLDLWDGWGFRHISAKHGWSALDREETELALATGLPAETEKASKFAYKTLEIGKGVGGVGCERVVVVDFEAGAEGGEEAPVPRGIVTSYNVVK